MKIQPENRAIRLINLTGNIEKAKYVCLQMIDEEKDWITRIFKGAKY